MKQNSNFNWQKIYLDYSPKLLGICRRYVDDIYTAEDIVQDSFITAIQKNDQLNDEKALFAWLKKIVVNNALQHIRKHSKDTFVTTEPLEIPDTYSEMDHHLLEEKNVFVYDFTSEELLSSIDSLPPHHKSVFNLYFIENHSHAEISGLLGITVNTSKSHLLRAKKSIQNYLMKNFVNQNTPKKKMAQLLVVFGLGGLLWAQTFKSKFADFTIQPSKKLQIPSDLKINNTAFSSSNTSLKKKTVIGGTFLVIIILSVFFLNPKNSFFSTNQNSALPILTDNNETVGKKTKNHFVNTNSDSKEKSDNNAVNQSATNIIEEKNTAKREIRGDETGLKSRSVLKKTAANDTIEEAPKKVIVVKKIIKRDTVFIEK
ncbi:sigma-70 family RNA polymerase sigma factor [Chryseobacterium gambrini]|uniref:RNA polymerase sigma factor n=1 Tax=Chryseobacterium gambrini TaxID=373672 RepID=A0AAJ1R950_9FLAO|nr:MULTISPECIES: sigma-70 family RNA polymerase sigma factor [Chryseobacterium]MDN4014499.1 sigma-70 family RNA polymerase sigma factor [Chryseobacterium gambrini]MDN4031526.1 sigma-70 family RNA polymerase sigma factor [Chryseobacterium gambrini]QWA38404.1 sigma-70 family RNA polymerase sigma factor [Chryseobacterium sp. ZHDP1]